MLQSITLSVADDDDENDYFLVKVFIELEGLDNLNDKAKWRSTTTSLMLLLLRDRDLYEGGVVPPRVLEMDCCGGLEVWDERVNVTGGEIKSFINKAGGFDSNLVIR